MRKEQFFEKHRHLQIQQQELERKWRILKEEEEMARMWEQAQVFSNQSIKSVGGQPTGGGPSIILTTSGQAEMYTWVNQDTQNYELAFLNYVNTKITKVETEYGFNTWDLTANAVHEKGWVVYLEDKSNSNIKKIIFYDINGTVISTLDVNSNNFGWGTDNYKYVRLIDYANLLYWVFDGEKLFQGTLIDDNVFLYSYTKDIAVGVITYALQASEDETLIQYYKITGDGETVFYQETLDPSVEQLSSVDSYYDSDFIAIYYQPAAGGAYNHIKLVNILTGDIKLDLDLTGFTTIQTTYYGTNSWFCLYQNETDYYITAYRGDLNLALTSNAIDKTVYPNSWVSNRYEELYNISDSPAHQSLSILFYSNDGSEQNFVYSNNVIAVNFLENSNTFTTTTLSDGDDFYFITNPYNTANSMMVWGYNTDPEASPHVAIYAVNSGGLDITPIPYPYVAEPTETWFIHEYYNTGNEYTFVVGQNGDYLLLRISSDCGSIVEESITTTEFNTYTGGNTFLLQDYTNNENIWISSVAMGWQVVEPADEDIDDPDGYSSESHTSADFISGINLTEQTLSMYRSPSSYTTNLSNIAAEYYSDTSNLGIVIGYHDESREGLITIKLYNSQAELLQTYETTGVIVWNVQMVKDRAQVVTYNKIYVEEEDTFYYEYQIHMITADGYQTTSFNLPGFGYNRYVNDAYWLYD